MFDTNNSKQNDYDFIDSLFQNKDVMFPIIDSEAERKIKVLTENVLDLTEDENERAYWSERIANITMFVSLAKQMYEELESYLNVI